MVGVQAQSSRLRERRGLRHDPHLRLLGIGPPAPSTAAPCSRSTVGPDTHGHHGTCSLALPLATRVALQAGHRGMQVGPMLRAFPGQRGGLLICHTEPAQRAEAASGFSAGRGCPEPIVLFRAAATAVATPQPASLMETRSLSCGLQLEAVEHPVAALIPEPACQAAGSGRQSWGGPSAPGPTGRG